MTKRIRIFGGAALLSVVALGSVFAVARLDQPEQLAGPAQRLQPCPDSPNCVCSTDARDEVRVEAFPISDLEPEAALERLVKRIDGMPRTTVVQHESGYARIEFRSLLFGYVDDLELQVNPENEHVEVRSASRTGYSDMGVNRDRVNRIHAIWRDEVAGH